MCETCGCKEAETFEAREKKIGGISIAKNPNFPRGTSLQAFMKTNRSELRKLFGNPNYGGMRGQNNEYNLILGGKRVTIYDVREESKRGTKYFNIGSQSLMGAVILAQIISAHRGERVFAKETSPRWIEDEGRHEEVSSIDGHPDLTYEQAEESDRYSRQYRTRRFGAEDKHPKLSAKAKSAYVFPKTQTYPIGDLKHGKIALVYSTWPDNKKDAQKVRTAVFKKYPSLRKWFKDGKYEVKGAESFEAKGCPHCELKNCGYDEVANYCPEAARIINEQEGMMNVRSRFDAEGKVRTMSGKPHTPRKLKKDKDITPKEAAKRMKLEAESGQMCEVCHVNDDLPYDADHFKECRRCSKSVCLECWDEMEHDEKFGIVCGSCWVVLDNVAQFGAEEGTFYDEGRTAANAVFMPDMKDRESFGLMDAEYAFTFGLSPDELVSEIDNNSKRYTQFSWGWGQEWDKLNMDTILNPETFNGEMMGEKPFQEYMPDISDFKSSMILVGGLLVGLLGYNKVIDSKKAETFNASEACSEDTDCPEGKVCVDGKCLPICVDDGDCASWQECRDDLHPTEKVCGEDKNDSNGNPFTDPFNRGDKDVENPNDAPTENSTTYSTTTKAVFGVGIVGAIVIGIKVLGGMQDKESGE